jgi:hypothetical protein
MIGRAARERRRGTAETKLRKVQFVDDAIYDPDRIVLSNLVFDAFGKQCDRVAIIAFTELLHESTNFSAAIQFKRSSRFHTAPTHKRQTTFKEVNVQSARVSP